MFSVHSFGISLSILVTRIFVIPIADPKRAIGADLFADGAEPTIRGRDEIFFGDGFEAGAIGDKAVVVDGVLVNVAHENVAAIFLRKLIALIDTDAAISSHVMFVVHDGRQQFVSVWICGRSTLANVNSYAYELL